MLMSQLKSSTIQSTDTTISDGLYPETCLRLIGFKSRYSVSLELFLLIIQPYFQYQSLPHISTQVTLPTVFLLVTSYIPHHAPLVI